MADKLQEVKDYIKEKEGNTLVGEIENLIGDTSEELHILEWFKNDKDLLTYAELKLKEDKEITIGDRFTMLKLEIKLGFKCSYFKEFQSFLKTVKRGGDISWDSENNQRITADQLYQENEGGQNNGEGDNHQSGGNGQDSNNGSTGNEQQDNGFNQFEETNTNGLRVNYARNYIKNGGTFYSPTKGKCNRGPNTYRGVCSTGSFNVLRRLGLPKISNSTEVDQSGKTLKKMGLKYIGKVDPKNPEKNGYKPQDGDTAVRKTFTKKSGKRTQHQATYLNGHRISDAIQNQMSCYRSEPNEPQCLIYRYQGKKG